MLKRVSLGYFARNNLGDILTALTTELSTLELQSMKMVDAVINGYIQVAVILLCVAIFCPPAALVALLGVLVSAFALRGIGRQSARTAPVGHRDQAVSYTHLDVYKRQMFPCLMTGALMLTCTPLRCLIVSLRQLHIPQKLIVAISVTLRYFPAIREEVGYIRDAMKLRDIRGLARLECTVMPLMVSATETAEELSAAAVTRGIENPARKTSAVSLRLSPLDFFGMLAGLALLVLSFVVQ